MHKEIFDAAHGRLGLGCMRFPTKADGNIDTETVRQMVDLFMREGFNYFDTAHGYLDGRSERMVRTCLTTRYPRDSYLLADKLSSGFFEKEEDIVPFFHLQLEECGVDWFDYYLMHAINAQSYEKYKACKAFETASRLKAEGRIGHVGMSFHDSAEVLDRILGEQSAIEFVQLQLNYLDWDSPSVQSRLCYEVCMKHSKPVIVMEPAKGGSLCQLHPKAQELLDGLPGARSNASYAMRFVMGLEGVAMVLSGMSTLDQVEDNVHTFKEALPLGDEEKAVLEKVVGIINQEGAIACTDCRYCTEVCPIGMPIPAIFRLMNGRTDKSYEEITEKMKASKCLGCGKCEKACPQKLPIRRYLSQAAMRYEKK